MRIIHNVARTVGDNTASEVVLYEFAGEVNDFWQHIHDAIMDYCTTPEGRQRVADGHMATYDDFLDFVPDEFCKKHGFDRILVSAEAKHYDSQQQILSIRSILYYLHQLDRAQTREEIIQYTIPPLAKMMEEMQSRASKIDKWGFTKIARTAIHWSTEYVDRGESDLRGFVQRKLDELETPKSTKKSNAQA